MNNYQQQQLDLFPQVTFERILKDQTAAYSLIVKKSNRMTRGWNVTINKYTGARTLTIPSTFDSAPEPAKRALINWALLPFPHSQKEKKLITSQRKELERFIRQHLIEAGKTRPAISRINQSTLQSKTSGVVYDLKVVFDSVNDKYFNNSIHSFVRWGTKGSTTSYQTIRTSADGTRWNLITIAGAYNHLSVPLFALESVMYHEMLHIAIPPFRQNGKNVIHGKTFREAERQFPYFHQWRQWEKNEVRNLSRELRKKNK